MCDDMQCALRALAPQIQQGACANVVCHTILLFKGSNLSQLVPALDHDKHLAIAAGMEAKHKTGMLRR